MTDIAQVSSLCADDCQQILTYLSASSLLMLVLSVVGLPWLIARLPSDFFQQKANPPRHSIFCTLSLIARNLFALLLLIAGVAMLVLPGQGLLCIVMALALSDLPFKWRVMQRLVSAPSISAVLTWIRHSRGKPPFEL